MQSGLQMKKSSVDCSASDSWIRGCTMKPNNVSSSKTLERRRRFVDKDLLGVRPQHLKPTPGSRRRSPPLVVVDAHQHNLSSSRTPQEPYLRRHRALLSCTPIYPPPQPQPQNVKASQQELQELRRLAILSMRAAIAKSPTTHTHTHTHTHTTTTSLSHSHQTLNSPPICPPPQPQPQPHPQDLQDLRRLAILSMRAAIALPSTSPLSPDTETQTMTHTTSLSPDDQTQIPTSQNDHSGPAAHQQLLPEPEPEPELEGDQDHGEIFPPCSPVPSEEDGDLIAEQHTHHDSEASPIVSDDELMTTDDDDDFDARTKAFIHRITAMCSW